MQEPPRQKFSEFSPPLRWRRISKSSKAKFGFKVISLKNLKNIPQNTLTTFSIFEF